MKVQYPKGILQSEGASLCQSIRCSITEILRDSVAVTVVVVVVVGKRPRAIAIAKITIRISIHEFPILSIPKWV